MFVLVFSFVSLLFFVFVPFCLRLFALYLPLVLFIPGVLLCCWSLANRRWDETAASPLFLFFCIFPGLPFLSCCLCYYWKTKTMVDGDGVLNRGDRGSSPVFFFVLVSVLLLSVPLSFARSAPPFSFLLFSVSPSLSFPVFSLVSFSPASPWLPPS